MFLLVWGLGFRVEAVTSKVYGWAAVTLHLTRGVHKDDALTSGRTR